MENIDKLVLIRFIQYENKTAKNLTFSTRTEMSIAMKSAKRFGYGILDNTIIPGLTDKTINKNCHTTVVYGFSWLSNNSYHK